MQSQTSSIQTVKIIHPIAFNMLGDINLTLILIAALVASISPGPATLAIAGTSMTSGRRSGLALASGITTGSFVWSISAALGLGTIMLANAWMFEIVRYVGAAYLIFLAFKSAKSALSKKQLKTKNITGSIGTIFSKGLALHITNPKAILFFGSLYAIGMPADATWLQLLTVILSVGLQSMIVFHGYAFLFSTQSATRIYIKLRRWFEALFSIGFGAAGIKILTARLQ